MKILWANHRDIQHPRAGGAERTIFEISRRLSLKGHLVHLASSAWCGARSTEVISGVKIARFPSYLGPHLTLPILAAKRPRPDVIIDDLAHVLPWASERLTTVPGVAFFRHLHARTLPGQVAPVLSKILGRVEASYPLFYPTWPFVTETKFSVEDLASLGIARSRCHIIPPGVDAQLFQPGHRYPSPTLIYFGGLRAYKRPRDILVAFRIVLKVRPDVTLRIVGTGPELPALRSLASALDIDRSTFFLGRISDSALSKELGAASINIHTSIAEGWGYAVLEASAAGVPTVAYAAQGLVDANSANKGIAFVRSANPVDLATEILRALGEAETRGEMSRTWAQRFDWETATKAWETYLENIARGRVNSGALGPEAR